MRRGRDMNVFSMMSAVICARGVGEFCTGGKGDGEAHFMRVAIGKVDRNGAADGLAI